MRKLVLLLLSCGPAFALCGSYSHCRQVTFDHTKAGVSDTANYPALISGTYAYLATVANGGLVQHTATQTGGGASITVPADLILTSDSACSAKLSWEYETYNAVSGLLNIHANVGTLTHSSDLSAVYLCYGNAAVTTWQGNVNSTWDANFKSVWHFGDGTTLSANDSTSNANNSTSLGGTAGAAGKIDGAANLVTWNTNYVTMSNANSFSSAQAHTLEAWIYKTVDISGGLYAWVISGFNGGAGGTDLIVADSGTDTVKLLCGGSIVLQSTGTISLNAWHHIAVVYNGSLRADFYIDGAFDSFGTALASWTGGGAAVNTIGELTGSIAYGFVGKIDETRISNVARSADYILAEYNNLNSPSTFYSVGSDLIGVMPSGARRRIL